MSLVSMLGFNVSDMRQSYERPAQTPIPKYFQGTYARYPAYVPTFYGWVLCI